MHAVYTKKHLLEALKNAGLPHTYQSLLKYEANGLIPPCTSGIERVTGNHFRLYSADEITSIVEKVKAHKG